MPLQNHTDCCGMHYLAPPPKPHNLGDNRGNFGVYDPGLNKYCRLIYEFVSLFSKNIVMVRCVIQLEDGKEMKEHITRSNVSVF